MDTASQNDRREPGIEFDDFRDRTQGRGSRESVSAYPMPDRGRDAWLFLWVGCFLTFALTWGEEIPRPFSAEPA